MRLYFAPMEGITGYIYRNAYWRHFPNLDKVYAPFLQPNQKRVLAPKEERDVLPENNLGIPLVPQILTCSADGFIRAGKALEEMGYREINLNLGCPSGTVVSKGKGAGMLQDTEQLRFFFEAVFKTEWKAAITVKTRLGMTEDMDFGELLEVYKQYPIAEVIIHPRYRSDFYKGLPRMEAFEQALTLEQPICYNANIFCKEDAARMEQTYAGTALQAMMLGRGLLANPALAREIRGGEALTKTELRDFHDDVLESYQQISFGERNTLFKMKELWNYWGTIFEDAERALKKVRKANRFTEYQMAVDALFRDYEFTETHGYCP